MPQHSRFSVRVLAMLTAALGLNACGGTGMGAPQSYTVGGVVSGLAGSSLVLQNGNGTELTVSANGTFVFPSSVAAGSAYAISIKAQPTNSSQSCVILNASGEVTIQISPTLWCLAPPTVVSSTRRAIRTSIVSPPIPRLVR